MPNAPRPENPARTIRVDDDLWALVKDRAARDKVTASEVVRTAVRHYLRSTT